MHGDTTKQTGTFSLEGCTSVAMSQKYVVLLSLVIAVHGLSSQQ
jgi:hypothetical protein